MVVEMMIGATETHLQGLVRLDEGFGHLGE